MSEENHYKTLEVPENASPEEIKKAYRRLSLKYHPDKNPGKPEVIETFQKISSAFEVLGDPQKKAEYDGMKNNPFLRMNSMGGNGDMPPFQNMDDLFANLFFAGMPGMMPMGGMQGMPGGFPFAGGPNIQVFRNGVPINVHQGLQKPTPIIHTICINMEQVLNGASVPLEIERWIIENGNKVFEKQTIYVNIPKGSDDNEIIMLRDIGNFVNEQCKGDVKIFIKVENDSGFRRHGLDLVLEKTISLKEALCGFTFDMKYINGKNYSINNQAGNIIVPEYQKVISGMGLAREGHKNGNLIIHFKVQFPEKLNEEQIAKLREAL
uniref:J domain-containing protein n=1 Tax=viral metagenome TaxID=1070528 RepID=A0A6C0HCR1_9ZZZZ